MHWSAYAVWWHVYPLGFLDAERHALSASSAATSRLPRLEGWLDYLVELGCNGLALGPVFASETHGYDTVDHFRIDPRLGDEDDLLQVITAAHDRGVRVLLDGVFNHVGRGFPAFADVTERGTESRYASWFRPGSDGSYATFEGHHGLVALNHAEPAVADYVTEVMVYWLNHGVDGWRLDAAYAVPQQFWRTVTDRIRVSFPDAWLLGEVIHGDYGSYIHQGGLDAVTQYELWKAIWSALNDRNFFELAWALDRHNAMLETFRPLTFVGNHDTTRIASQLTEIRHLELALVLLLTLGGIPSIYAGDEQAFRGVKEHRVGGDDAIRPAFPETPDHLAPHGWRHYRLHQFLIGLRRRHPWLTRAHTEVTELTNTALSYTVTEGDNAHQLAVTLNIADQPEQVPIPLTNPHKIAGTGEIEGRHATLPAFGWTIATNP